jgi:RNA polymerase sigma factor (sigma-70 family)
MRGGSDDDAADMFQEGVLILIEKIKTGSFRGESSVKTFLTGIVRNLWLHERRTRTRRSEREKLYSVQDEETEDFSDRMFSKVNTNVMKTIFQKVGDVCSNILTGVYYEKRSMKELLQKFHFDNEQVLRNRKARCMKKLKQILSENPDLLTQLKNLSFYE